MSTGLQIVQLHSIEEYAGELANLLIQVVDDGASIGFLPPMQLEAATGYWESVLEPGVILFVAKCDGQIAGSIQLHLCRKPNGTHRAEIAKLMTHPQFRRKGIGRALMLQAEERAKQEGRSLIVLDTREGDPSNLLYASMGYQQAGLIPNFARSANGELHATVYYYKSLSCV